MRTATLGAALASAALLLFPAPARAGDYLTSLLETAEDANAALPDRENAIGDATVYAQMNRASADPLQPAIERLLKQTEKKKTDPTYARLVALTFRAMDVFTPYPNLGPVVRGYLTKDTDPGMRLAALGAIAQHGAVGLVPDLTAIFDEPTQKKDRVREGLEKTAVKATCALPGGDAVKVLQAILKKSKAHSVQMHVVTALAELVDNKPPSELKVDEAIAKTTLMEFASATYPDVELSCAAAIALTHWASWDGVAEIMKRIDAEAEKYRPSPHLYKAVCTVAHKLPGGFAGVRPETVRAVSLPQRSDAVAEMKAWWEKAKGGKPESSLFESLAAAGVKVPKDTSPKSKEAISCLIAGLEVPTRTLRYACLDLLVKRTGKTDMARQFKRLQQTGGRVTTSEQEPEEGYPEGDPRAAELYELQKGRAKEWQTWWNKGSDRAVFDGGLWKVP